ncbi:MAG: hypothetical protein HFE73_00955 [Firmicutes bacterium]|nr:hypothetical protein [Bacillota bacterium]
MKNHKVITKNITILAVLLVLLFSFTGCSGPEAPMEATIDGNTIILGQTTMEELIDMGYEAHLERVQDVAHDGDEYIGFAYSLDKGAGNQFWVSVCVPWSGSTNINKETSLSATEGIVRTITFSKGSTEKVTATYDGTSIQDMTFDYALDDWGAEKDDSTTLLAYVAEVKDGSLRFSAENTTTEELYDISIRLSMNKFEKMQKQ